MMFFTASTKTHCCRLLAVVAIYIALLIGKDYNNSKNAGGWAMGIHAGLTTTLFF